MNQSISDRQNNEHKNVNWAETMLVSGEILPRDMRQVSQENVLRFLISTETDVFLSPWLR